MTEHEPRHFGEELEELKNRLLTMGHLAEDQLRRAMSALVERDGARLTQMAVRDVRVDDLQIEIDERCVRMLALRQPVAGDLRTIVSALKINADLHRVSALTVNIAQAGQRYLRHPPVKPLIDLPRMGVHALGMLRQALDSFVSRNVAPAIEVLKKDEWLDGLKDQIFRELLTYMLGNSATIEPAVDLILIARHLERVGDHATNIAEDVIFIVEARDIRHRSQSPATFERRRTSDAAPI